MTFSTTTISPTDVYGLLNLSADNWTANGNTVGGLSVTNLGASGNFSVFGMRRNTGIGKIFNAAGNTIGGAVANSIQLAGTGTTSQVVGMATFATVTTWTSNTVRNLTNNHGTGTSFTSSLIGMSLNNGTINQAVSQNTVFGLTNTSPTLATTVVGIVFTGGPANVVERNRI